MNLMPVVNDFQFEGEPGEVVEWGEGHIHKTYLLRNSSANFPDYILQQINHKVFTNVDELMNNMAIVTLHLRSRLEESGSQHVTHQSLSLVLTHEGKSYVEKDGKFWRMMNFIPDHHVYEVVPNKAIAYQGAKMFGRFINHLADLDPKQIVATIPDFHNVNSRFSNLMRAIDLDPVGRLKDARAQVNWAKDHFTWMARIQEQSEKGNLPVRITHNDTKINNVLFDQHDKGLCIIDLDTTMPGLLAYDFGDGIRTFANRGREDDINLDNVALDLEIFKAFSSGFIESTQNLMTSLEFETLPIAAALFPYLMGIRFLTDYISGDTYYKTNYADHNLIRAKAQLHLAEDAIRKQQDMKKILNNIYNPTNH